MKEWGKNLQGNLNQNGPKYFKALRPPKPRLVLGLGLD